MRKIIILLLGTVCLAACHKQVHVTGVQTQAIPVNASSDGIQDLKYLEKLAPVKAAVDKEMNVKVGYVPSTLWVGSPECPLLNWLTDVLWEAAKAAYPGTVDMALVNMGSVRDEWLAGDLTFGHIYKVMPFENQLVVITLSGQDIIDLCASFAQFGAQGVAGARVTIIDGTLAGLSVGGKAVDPKKNYTVATSDYLITGADNLDALTHYTECWRSGLAIRDLYIQAAQSQDTILAAVDGRMTIEP